MSRFPEITPNDYTDDQNELAQRVAASRGGMRGPFVPALHSPGILRAIEATGAYVRFENSLPDDLKELATITVGRFWGAQYEWYAHANLALKVGVDPAIIEAIRQGEAPTELSPAQAAIYNFCVELNGTHGVSDPTFNAVASRFGTRGVMDLIGINGHYSMISMILNVARVPTPDGSVPLKPLKHQR
ncbi:MAG TPA: carboxymuconolactone decarboxylase family protein [Stellaceae bacterium]|jgi:4-carboxymuconolactone decarboxylase|nr:carboxymuconolactone decarboxylase family protein [Stellaceae bacterium]